MQRSLYLLRLGHLSSQMFADSGLLSPSRSCEDGEHMFKCNILRIAQKKVDNLKTHSVPNSSSSHPKPPKQKTSKNTPEAKQNLPEKFTLPKTNSSHLKIGHPKRKVLFQPSIFRCHVSFREGIPLQKKNWQNPRHGCESPRACLSQ